MGQRLVLNIYDAEDNDTILANAYYHWSGFLDSTVELLKEIKENLDDDYINKLLKKYNLSSVAIRLGDSNVSFEKSTAIKKLIAVYLLEKTTEDAKLTRQAQKDFVEYMEKNGIKKSEYKIKTGETDRNEGLIEFTEKDIEENNDASEVYCDVFVDFDNDYLMIEHINMSDMPVCC